MQKIFISDIVINKVRHLRDIQLPLEADERKHLILTGKNGSGKTSVLARLAYCLGSVTDNNFFEQKFGFGKNGFYIENSNHNDAILRRLMTYYHKLYPISNIDDGIFVSFNVDEEIVRSAFKNGDLIVAFYEAERRFYTDISEHIEKVELNDSYNILEEPRRMFAKYLADLKVTEALNRNGGKTDKADEIKLWFEKFEELLRQIFEDETLRLLFDDETFSFQISEEERELFDFNTMSDGFAAILDIVADLIMRMQKQKKRAFIFDVPGIVLIDEIETHLHLEMQKKVLNLLTTLFPNIQFIISSHSPFVLNSVENAVICDLEKNIIVKEGLSEIPYSGIVEGYFDADEMSKLLEEKFLRYKELVCKKKLSDNDFEEIARLEMYLDEIPDYLALNVTTEYQRLKLQFENREDI